MPNLASIARGIWPPLPRARVTFSGITERFVHIVGADRPGIPASGEAERCSDSAVTTRCRWSSPAATGARLEREEGVIARAEQLSVPRLRWLLVPFAGLAFVATMVEAVRRRNRQLAVKRMSDEWLRDHALDRLE